MRARSFPPVLFLAALSAGACGRGASTLSRPPSPTRPPSPIDAPASPKDTKESSTVAAIDRALRDAWKRENLTPAPRADDATFVRRAYVDIAGTIPPGERAATFAASADPDKRKKLVDELLASPEYAEHWMSYWDDVLMGREVRGPLVDRLAFRSWLRARFEANAPWDRLVRDLVSATGQNSLGGARVKLPQAMAMDDTEVDLTSINGAVNWTLRFEQSPQDLAGSASRVFLGVQIQCAQCHDHKTEKWKQDDFRRFSSAFLHARVEPIESRQKGAIRRVELVDAPRTPPRYAKNAEVAPIARARATALDGTDLEKGEATRKTLAAWMTSPMNPWFARAFVNRMWGHFLGRGFYDPVDDIRLANTPAMPALLDALSADFVAHDFDVKHLIRTICATEAYHLAASASAKPDAENTLWARFHLVPLGPEELLNALLRATSLENAAEKAGIQNMEQLRAQLVRQYAFLFELDEVDDVPDFAGTVTQALSLLNGALVGHGSRAVPGSALAEVLAKNPTDEGALDALVLRVLARRPTSDERARWGAYVERATKEGALAAPAPRKPAGAKRGGGPLERLANRAGPVDARRAAFEDVLWALLNSSEFVFNH